MPGLGGLGGGGKKPKSKSQERREAIQRENEKLTITKEDIGVLNLGLSDVVAAPQEAMVNELEAVKAAIKPLPEKLFDVGEIHCTEKAIRALALAGISKHSLVERHQHGDFGELEPLDAEMNLRCALGNSAVRSLYPVELNETQKSYLWSGNAQKAAGRVILRVQTEGDRKVTWIRVEGE